MDPNENLKELRNGYVIKDMRPERNYFILTCRKCGDRWSLSTRATKGANILHLLNHAAGHDEVKK